MLREALKISSPLALYQGKCQDFTAGHSGTLHRLQQANNQIGSIIAYSTWEKMIS